MRDAGDGRRRSVFDRGHVDAVAAHRTVCIRHIRPPRFCVDLNGVEPFLRRDSHQKESAALFHADAGSVFDRITPLIKFAEKDALVLYKDLDARKLFPLVKNDKEQKERQKEQQDEGVDEDIPPLEPCGTFCLLQLLSAHVILISALNGDGLSVPRRK